MNSEQIIRNLIKNETDKDKKFILFMLLKFNESINLVKSKDHKSPFLIIEDNSILLIYKNDEVEDMEYIFTDAEEILIILQKLFYEGKRISFYSEVFEEDNSKEELMILIEEAVKNKNKEKFDFYAKKYNNLR